MTLSEREIGIICEYLGGKMLPMETIAAQPSRIARLINTCSLGDMQIVFDSDEDYEINSIRIKHGNLVVNIGSDMHRIDSAEKDKIVLIREDEYDSLLHLERHGKELEVWTP